MKKTPKYRGVLRLCPTYIFVIFSLPCFANSTLAYSLNGPPHQNRQQEYILTGTVKDGYGPMPGVHVLIKGTDTGTFTDKQGDFSLTVSSSNTLVFSYMGYHTLEVSILGKTSLEVELQPEATQLQEVEVNAGYYTVKERERTGSIATIKAKSIEKQPVGNPLAAMQGHLSGVNIVQSTGVPGGGYNIEIRGKNFISGVSDPLFIVDGVPYGSRSLGTYDVSGQIIGENISPLNAINPNDIESIEVLKDADATAIYGSRAANGVVLITTKRGKVGKTRFKAHLSTSLGQISNFLDLMNTQQYLEIRKEAIINDGYGSYLDNPSFDFAWPDVKSWDNSRYTDWQKQLIGGTAYRNNAQISVSGGNAETQFLISSAYQKETTVFPGDANYKKATVHSNINHRSHNERFTFNLSTIYTNENSQLPGMDLSLKAYTLEPNAPELFNAEGNINWENNTWENPLATLEENYESIINTLITNALISYKIMPNLELKSSFGFNSYRLDAFKTSPSSARNPSLGLTPQNYSSLSTNGSKRESWIVEPQMNWKKKWNELQLEILVGTTFQQENTRQLVQKGTGFPNNNLLRNLTAATILETLTDADSEYRYNAVFGRLNLNLFHKYILNLTGRRDGSSRFGPGRKFGNFGAVGAAWLFSEESIFGDHSLLSFGKLRTSFGTTGSDNIGDYRFLDTYNITGFDYDGITILEPTGIFNPLFGWETNKKLEAALELGFFNDRLLVHTSWYRNRSSNQLIGIPLAATTGFNSLTSNFDATVENTGFEIDFRTVNIRSGHLHWSTTFNITIPNNKLVKFDGLENSTFANRLIIGKPLTLIKRYHALGVDPETGIYQFEDYNEDGIISSLEDKQWLVDSAPKFYGGLGNTISYGNATLEIFFQFKKQKAINEIGFKSTPGHRGNASVVLLDRWQEPGDIKSVQMASAGLVYRGDTSSFQRDSNAGFSDASFIRLRNVSLNYKIPMVGNNLDINMYLQGQNLLTFTHYNGPDPEQASNSQLPQLRQITLGFQLGF